VTIISDTASVPVATNQTSQQLLMRLQESIDPMPYRPLGKIGEITCNRDSLEARLTPNPTGGMPSLLQRLTSLGVSNKPAWLSGQPSPLSDLQTPTHPLHHLIFGRASDASSERLRTPARAAPMRSQSLVGRLDHDAAKNQVANVSLLS
jgi:hypothetical protein